MRAHNRKEREGEPLFASSSPAPLSRSRESTFRAAFLLSFGLFGVIVGLRGFRSPSPSVLDEQGVPNAGGAAGAGLSLSVVNNYTRQNALSSLYPFEYIVENFRTTTLTVEGVSEDSSISWSIDGIPVGQDTTIEFVFQSPSLARTFRVQVEEHIQMPPVAGLSSLFRSLSNQPQEGAAAASVRYLDVNVMCKYVRREVRALTVQDKDDFLDALATLSSLPSDHGKQKFGGNYWDKDYFNLKHAGLNGCSQFHKGAEFLGAHMAFTLEFERSLQAINPSVSVPYWDFTRDDALLGSNWRSSRIFMDDFFGPVSPEGDHVVKTSRFAWWPIMTNAARWTDKFSGFGFATDTWNEISTPFLTRHDGLFGMKNDQPLPGCGDHYRCLTQGSWMNFTDCMESAAHENIHQLVGGVWNTEPILADLAEAHPALKDLYMWIAARADRVMQVLMAEGIMSCPANCTASTDAEAAEDCSCSCPSLEGDRINSSTLAMLDSLGVFKYLDYYDFSSTYITHVDVHSVLPRATATDTDEDQFQWTFSGTSSREEDIQVVENMLRMYCNPGNIGDMYTSYSTNDPIFWVIHPTLDRLWHLKRLAHNEAFDERWISKFACYGHDATDILPFADLVGEGTGQDYTNSELYELFNPENPSLPYIYDNFEWPHCLASGFDLAAAPIGELASVGY